MRIQAKTKLRDVVIVDFVTRYDKTYAVVILEDGRLQDYPISELIVTDNYLKDGE